MEYSEILRLIDSTLEGRNPGHEITPLEHQNMIMAVLEYAHDMEIRSRGILQGLADEDTIPVMPKGIKICYVSLCQSGETTYFYAFHDENNESISVSCDDDEVKFVILFWNTKYWEKMEQSLKLRGATPGPEPTREYLTPQISSVSYPDVAKAGGIIRPVVVVTQQVRITSEGTTNTVTITATYQWNSSKGRMETSYTNSRYMKSGGDLSLTFTFSDVASGVVPSPNGAVMKSSAASSPTRTKIAGVSVVATMNNSSASSALTADIYQEAGEIPAVTTYLTPTITSFSYGDISRSGGSARPLVTVSQVVRIVRGSDVQTKTITATYQWNSSAYRMEISYTNSSYMKQDGALALEFSFSSVASGVITDTETGIVTKSSASVEISRTRIAIASVSATINNVSTEQSGSASVYQQAAQQDMTAYYGKGDTLPTSVGSNSFTLQSGTNNRKVEGYARVLWIAIPNGINATVTGTDSDNDPITVNVSTTQISGYKLYYRQTLVEADEANFKIVI